jgi:hypothetical protein
VDSLLEGMIEGFSLGNHLLVVGYTGRLFREGSPRPCSGQAEASTSLEDQGYQGVIRPAG